MVSIISLFMAAIAQFSGPSAPPPSSPPAEQQFVTQENSLQNKFFALTQERNQKLLAACGETATQPVCKAIQELNAGVLSQEEQAGLLYLEMLESGKISPKTGAEEALLSLSKEYGLKERAIDKSVFEKDLSLEEIQAQKLALYEEKWEKMGQIQGEHPASATLTKWGKERALFSALHALEHNYALPANETEERIQEILIEYSIKRTVLFS